MRPLITLRRPAASNGLPGASARRLVEIARRNETRREAQQLPPLPIPTFVCREMKPYECLLPALMDAIAHPRSEGVGGAQYLISRLERQAPHGGPAPHCSGTSVVRTDISGHGQWLHSVSCLGVLRRSPKILARRGLPISKGCPRGGRGKYPEVPGAASP